MVTDVGRHRDQRAGRRGGLQDGQRRRSSADDVWPADVTAKTASGNVTIGNGGRRYPGAPARLRATCAARASTAPPPSPPPRATFELGAAGSLVEVKATAQAQRAPGRAWPAGADVVNVSGQRAGPLSRRGRPARPLRVRGRRGRGRPRGGPPCRRGDDLSAHRALGHPALSDVPRWWRPSRDPGGPERARKRLGQRRDRAGVRARRLTPGRCPGESVTIAPVGRCCPAIVVANHVEHVGEVPLLLLRQTAECLAGRVAL